MAPKNKFILHILIFIISINSLLLNFVIAESRYVYDELGRKVFIKNFPPKRIVSLAPSITELVFALKQGGKLVGVTFYCNKPKEALKIPKVGGFSDPNIEVIVSLKPDLVIAVNEGNPFNLIENLKKFSIPVYAVKTKSLADILNNVLDIGKLLNAEYEAKKLHQKLTQFINNKRAAQAKAAKKIFFLLWDDPLTTIGRDSYINEIIELSGAISVTSIYSKEWLHINIEELLKLKFDGLIYVKHSNDDDNRIKKSLILKKIINLNNDNLYWVDEEILRPSVNFPIVVEQLSTIISHFK